MPRGAKPAAFGRAKTGPTKGAGRTVDWGRDSEIFLDALDEAQRAPESGRCSRCDTAFAKGDWVFRDGPGTPVGVNCCATERDLRPTGLGDLLDAEEIEGREWVPLAQVLPRGRSKADACPRCFMIPASNGECC